MIARTFLLTPDTDDSGAEANAVVRLIATEIELGQQMETGRMVQLLRMLGTPEAADLDQPAMAWMDQPVPFERMPAWPPTSRSPSSPASAGRPPTSCSPR